MRIELAKIAPLDRLIQCSLRDGNARAGWSCIDMELAAALRGDVRNVLFFGGAAPLPLPLGARIRPVSDVIDHPLTGSRVQPAQAPRKVRIEVRALC